MLIPILVLGLLFVSWIAIKNERAANLNSINAYALTVAGLNKMGAKEFARSYVNSIRNFPDYRAANKLLKHLCATVNYPSDWVGDYSEGNDEKTHLDNLETRLTNAYRQLIGESRKDSERLLNKIDPRFHL